MPAVSANSAISLTSVQCSTMRWLPFVIAGILIGMPALAAPKPWTLDAIMDLKNVSDPQITADGSSVAYVVSGRDVSRNAYSSGIWVVPATGGVGQRLTGSHFSDSHPRWSED